MGLEERSEGRELSAIEKIESSLFYRCMSAIGMRRLANYLTLMDYETEKLLATERAIVLTEYGR